MKQFEAGQEIETTIVQIADDTVFIDLGLKSEGLINKNEFTDDDGNVKIKEGDKIKAYFVSDDKGELHFTTRLSGENAGEAAQLLLEKAFKEQIPIEGRVEIEIKGGFEVKLGAQKAFCPHSQIGFKNKLNSREYIGKTLCFLITEYKNDGKNIIVSNRKVLEAESARKISELSERINEGTIITGTVKSLQSYGAFLDVEGFQVLLPVSEISHEHVKNISDFLSVGQTIKAKVIKADWNGERSKVSVSAKALESDPWETEIASLSVGQKISGKIARIVPFGLFVTIARGIDGLVHISSLENVKANTNISKIFKVGDQFNVIIEKINAHDKRISLKPASSKEQDIGAKEFLSSQDNYESYNPFAALLKK